MMRMTGTTSGGECLDERMRGLEKLIHQTEFISLGKMHYELRKVGAFPSPKFRGRRENLGEFRLRSSNINKAPASPTLSRIHLHTSLYRAHKGNWEFNRVEGRKHKQVYYYLMTSPDLLCRTVLGLKFQEYLNSSKKLKVCTISSRI